MILWVDSTHLKRIEETISRNHAETATSLAELGGKLDRLLNMATTQAQFDQELADAIADITSSLAIGQTAIDVAVQAIIDAINAGQAPADLTTEFNTLETARQAFKATIAAIPAQLPTTPSSGTTSGTPPVTPPTASPSK